MPSTKKYVPRSNIRSRSTQFGEVLSVGFDVDELVKFAQENRNERGFLNLTISPRREPTETATHSIYLDDYMNQRSQQASQPRQQSAPAPRRQAPAPQPPTSQGNPVDDIPF